jgi:hypothetical protein
MMAAIEEMITLVDGAYREEGGLAQLPQDDQQVYAALQDADTVGMFQVESRAQMASLPRMKPDKFYDVVVQVALIRPGPIVGKMVHPYLARRQGRESPDCLHPCLEPVLPPYAGRAAFPGAVAAHGHDRGRLHGGEAEDLRRAMGFKRSEKRMQEIEVKLRRGMERNGIVGAQQDTIVQSITAFALYWIPRIARRQLRAAGLRQRLAEGPLPRCFPCRFAEQPADGLLSPLDAGQGRPAARRACRAGGRHLFGMAVYHRRRTKSVPRCGWACGTCAGCGKNPDAPS